MSRIFKIGTRGSPLALAQAHMVQATMAKQLALATTDIEARLPIVPMSTSGDRIQSRPLREFGGKGLFTKEIEEALLSSDIDLAVHSMKDMPTSLPGGLVIAALLPREDPRDVFISEKADTLEALSRGARLGAASLRRQAQALRKRPDLVAAPLRGRVETRLRKVADGEVDATFLAAAGLKRLGLLTEQHHLISPDEMLPAVAQGAVGIEIREDDEGLRDLLASIHDVETGLCVAAERAFLAGLDGSCRTPIAGLAELSDKHLRLRGEVLSPDGAQSFAVDRSTHLSGEAENEAAALGAAAAAEVKDAAGADFFEALKDI